MLTDPLIQQRLATSDISGDLAVIRRFLTAAAINQNYCGKLLNDPVLAVRDGFGGEQFLLSELTINLLASIHVTSLPMFIKKLNEHLAYRLIPLECDEAAG